jgi:phage-related protein
MAIAGRIEYEITVNQSGLTKGLNEAKKQTSNFASTVGGIAKTAGKALGASIVAGATASAVAITKMAGSAINAYADFEQLKGGVETLFKDSANTIMQYAQNAYMTAGISANEYMEQATSFSASLLQSLAGDTEQASKITDMAIQDMADNMNKMGSSMESIQHAYQGFAKQNYTMLDNLKLGYGGTKTEM